MEQAMQHLLLACPPHRLSPPRGFTLIEALVSLLITTLSVSLLFQSIHALGVSRERASIGQQELRERMLLQHWFRDSVSGLQTEAILGSQQGLRFKGNQDGFSGVSFAGPGLGSPTPRSIEWRVDQGELQIDDPLAGATIGFGTLLTQVSFSFVDSDGHSHTRWPPDTSRQFLLPDAVVLHASYDGVSITAIGNPESQRKWIADHFEPEL